MKRTGREKTKVFRTLIRRIRMSDKPNSKTSVSGLPEKRGKNSKNGLRSFSAGKNQNRYVA